MAFSPIHMGEIELSRPLEPVEATAAYRDARIVVRLHGVPVGFATVRLAAGSASPAALRDAVERQLGPALRAHLEADGLPASAPLVEGLPAVEDPPCARPGPFGAGDEPATVALCTRNPPPEVRRTLESLLALDPAPAEILVIDNASTTDTAATVARSLDPERLRVVEEPVPGLSRARNRAIAEASTDLVAFTDDDVRLDAGWLHALRRGFTRAPHVACVTGLVAPTEVETPAQAVFEERISWSHGFAPRLFDLGEHRPADDPFFPLSPRFGAGASCIVRRSALGDIGPFDEALGPGTPTESGDDIDFFLRVILAGWTLAYEPAALAWHTHLRDADDVRRHLRGYGLGLGAYAVKHVRERRLVLHVPAALARLARDGRHAERAVGASVGVTREELRGLIGGPAAYARARRIERRRPPVERAAR